LRSAAYKYDLKKFARTRKTKHKTKQNKTTKSKQYQQTTLSTMFSRTVFCALVASFLLLELVACQPSQDKPYVPTPESIKQWLEAHNEVRAGVSPSATNMKDLQWDTTGRLVAAAKANAEKCIFAHTTNPVFGENIYMNTKYQNEHSAVMNGWAWEKKYFQYPNTCKQPPCRHYTQLVWAESTEVGCWVTFCPRITDPRDPNWEARNAYYYVCEYSKPGNTYLWNGNTYVMQAPYEVAAPSPVAPRVAEVIVPKSVPKPKCNSLTDKTSCREFSICRWNPKNNKCSKKIAV